METIARKPYQGIVNIVRFNWHFYVVALAFLVLLFLLVNCNPLLLFTGIATVVSIVVSLAVSYYIYDLSGLYQLNWLSLPLPKEALILNIHAGFDETSALLAQTYPQATLTVFDFYDADKHTEISIRRARKAYPAYPGTVAISTGHLPLKNGSVDAIFCLLSAHEIREREERVHFFKQLKKALKDEGKLIVVEHLRDLPNFLAYTVGFFHFHSEAEWKRTFEQSGLRIENKRKHTAFITAYTLSKNGASS